MKVHIKNYQAIKDALLEFEPGITAIIGPTNSGKSSIIRAIEGAINNRPGSSFVNYDAEFCEVTVEDLGHSIVWKKSKKGGSSYIIDGKELLKIGKSQIDEVGETLNMAEVKVDDEKFRLNFWKQMTPPFLVNKTSYQLFGFISQSKEQELISSYQESLQSDIKVIDKEIVALNAQVDSKTKDELRYISILKSLENISGYNLDMLESALGLRDSVNTLIVSYESLSKSRDEYREILKKQSKNIPEIESTLATLKEVLQLDKSVGDSINSYNLFADTVLTNKTSYDKLKSSVEVMSKKLEVISTLVNDIGSLETSIGKIKGLLESYELYKSSIKDIKYSIEKELLLQTDTMKELDSFKVCPLCGNDLTQHSHE